MNDIYRYKISPLLSYRDMINLNSLGIVKNEDVEKRKEEILKEISSLFPKNIVDMVGEDNLLLGEKIEWDEKWMGSTDYIDKIVPKDLKNTFSYGIDSYQRSFIFVRMNSQKGQFVISIFKRYTNLDMFVAIDPSGKCSEYIGTNVALYDNYIELLHNLFLDREDKYKLC